MDKHWKFQERTKGVLKAVLGANTKLWDQFSLKTGFKAGRKELTEVK